MPLRLFPATPTVRTAHHPLRLVPIGVAVVAAGGTVLTGSAGGTGSALHSVAVVVPNPPSKSLPAELDIAAPYVAPSHCLSGALPGVSAFGQLLNQYYGSHVYGINRTCDGDHGEGRALDWMIDGTSEQGLAVGNAITQWLTAPDSQGRPGAMARRFGISYIIWNGKIWGVYDMSAGWRTYTGPVPHIDHIHVTFSWDGGYQQTSWWTGVALTANRYLGPTSNPVIVTPTQTLTTSGYPVLSRGSTGADVQVAQRLVGADPDGEFGPLTEAAVRDWQGRQGVASTGVMDEATWAKAVALGLVENRAGSTTTPTTPPPTTSALAPYATTTLSRGSTGDAVVALQRALGGLQADGQFGPLTEQAVRTYQSSKGLAVTGVVDAAVWAALMGTSTSTGSGSGGTSSGGSGTATGTYAAYATTTLQRGSTGAAVVALQKGLGGLEPDGEFGPLTEVAVKRFEVANGLAENGIVDAAFWKVLEAKSGSTPSTSTSGALSQWYSTTLRRGSIGQAVMVLQRTLGGLDVDGGFGPLTEAAVTQAQASAGLPQTGVVDEATWRAIDT